ncbi:protein lin-12-like [Ruditapes philippinarum]|uniref:protein lin-12-like n=1 Tax=Ruditapes philippinarum TaxID=129788 RepID=UPI00295C36E8|nr:protein lin-12-like [Ruditapes philippinarum]
MSSAFGIIILVALAISLPCVEGGFWSWARGWSEEEPANCPSRNNVTHVCSSIESSNGTCFTIKCCDDFSYDESFESISDSSYESYEESSHGRSCRLCYSSRTCALYKCYRSCCERYERDAWGRCSNKTGELQCENGGVLRHTWWGVPFCKCPSGFRGHNCEIRKIILWKYIKNT